MWSQVGAVANVALTVSYLAIATSILLPLTRTGQLWRNRLGLFTGLIFFSCGIGHAIHAEHTIRMVIAHGWDSAGSDWHLGVWDSLTAVIAFVYWRERQLSGPPVDAGTLFEDLQRRQRELEVEAEQAELRAQLAVERELRARESFAQAFEAAPNGMALVDGSGSLIRVNVAFAAIVDIDPELLPGSPLVDLVLEEEDRAHLRAAIQQVSGDAIEVRLGRTAGVPAWARLAVTPLPDDDAASLLVQLEDVTERRMAQERLNHLALHDPLTGLPNRLLFHDRASAALRQARRSGRYTGCLFVDLDHFKVVNDSLGHTAGDRVLKALAERLVETLRVGDTVARMGGDEFCLLLQDLDDPAEASEVADRALGVLDGYVEIDGMQVTTGASIGVAVVGPHDGATSQTLVRDADTALYRAKGSQRGSHVVFDDAIRDDAQRRLRIEADLRRGLERNEITVVYQPQWSLVGEQVVGVEALVRWQHPHQGELEPAEFIDIAVETGLVIDLGRIVLLQGVRDLARWQEVLPDLELAVNLSSRQLGRSGFVREVQALLDAHGVRPSSLCFELTETDLTVLGRSALTTIDELRALGIRLAVDDVGTGQSSLTHLVTLPVDVIKIDRTFVEQVHLPGAKRAVVDALLSLARTIGVDVVAEGAETTDQVDVLRALGGDVIQGYVISHPLRGEDLEHLLIRRSAITSVD
jgi:diguanylate cyclase (GGDEF)-like protein/PAS domain S-box-containing protein